jgi:hypothetical protein
MMSNIEKSSFRTLSDKDVALVSGGSWSGDEYGIADDIIVTGIRNGFTTDFGSLGSLVGIGGYGASAGFGGYAGVTIPLAPPPENDVDRDRVPDSNDEDPNDPNNTGIVVTARVTVSEIREVNERIQIELYTNSIFAAFAGVFVADAIAGLTVTQQAVLAAGAAAAAPAADPISEAYLNSRFNYFLEEVRNPGIYPNQLPY